MRRLSACPLAGFRLGLPLPVLFFLSFGALAQNITIGNHQTQDITTNTSWSTVTVGNGGTLTVRSGDTLTVGTAGNAYTLQVVDFQNGSSVLVETGGVMIVYGKVNNSNNSDGIVINGELIVHGNFTGGNGSEIAGTGTMDTDGTITTSNSGSVFGSTNNCTTGPCSGNDLCGITNSITSAGQTICSGNSVTISADTPTGGSGGYSYIWESSTQSAGAGFTTASGTYNTQNYTTANLSETTWFRRKVISGSCTDVSEPVKITVIAGIAGSYTWNGSVSSDWHDGNNWCPPAVPASGSDVVIPSGTSNEPVISAAAECEGLTIQNGASLTISGTNALDVYGNFSNSGTFTPNNGSVSFTGSSAQVISGTNSFEDLTINNTAGVTVISGMQTVNGTLTLSTGNLSTNDSLRISFTNDGSISGTGSGTITGNVIYERLVTPGWHYLGNPKANGTVADFNDDLPYVVSGLARYYWYKESHADTDIQKGWEAVRNTSFSMASMRGVCAYVSANTIFDVKGSYDHSASYSSSALSYNTSGLALSDGWQLVGNPYPSTLDWGSATGWTKTNINDAIYSFDGTLDIVKSYVSGLGINGGTQYIPAMQSVFIQTLPGGGTISVNKDARSANSGSFLRKSMNLDVLMIRISSGNYSDETAVRFTDDATSFFDPKFDAYKLMNGGNYPSLYTKVTDDLYSINTLPGVTAGLTLPLHVAAGFDGSYELTFDLPSGFDPSLEVLLEDRVTGELVNLRMQNSYSFTASVQDNSERFSLIFRQPVITGSNAKNATDLFEVYNTGEKVFINFTTTGNDPARIDLINSLGQVVISEEVSGTGPVLFVEKGAVETGSYIVRMTSGNDTYAEQVFLRR